MKVYLVWDYMEGEIVGVFSSKDKANLALAKFAVDWELDEMQLDNDMGIESYEVDTEIPQ